MAAVPLAFLAVFFVWPLVAILRRSLVVDGRVDVPWEVLTSDLTRDVLWFTFWQASASTALTLAAALPLAWALSRFRFRGRSLVEAFVLVPFVLPTVVVATAFIALLPDGVERSVWAILLAHVFFNVAVVVRVVGAFWAALDRRLWDAAATLGASGTQRRERVGHRQVALAEPEDLRRPAAARPGAPPLADRRDGAAALEHPAQVRRRDVVPEGGDVHVAQLPERERPRGEREADVRVGELAA